MRLSECTCCSPTLWRTIVLAYTEYICKKWRNLNFFWMGRNIVLSLACSRLCPLRELERMGVETSQLALAQCVMRGVLGRERLRGRTVEKWRVKTKFCSTYKVHCYGWTVRHFSLPFGSGHLYTICKLSVLNNRTIVSQIKVNICEINKFLRNWLWLLLERRYKFEGFIRPKAA